MPIKKTKAPRDPFRERERLIQFISVIIAVATIYLLRLYFTGQNWTIFFGIGLYFIVGIYLEAKIPPAPPQKTEKRKPKGVL